MGVIYKYIRVLYKYIGVLYINTSGLYINILELCINMLGFWWDQSMGMNFTPYIKHKMGLGCD